MKKSIVALFILFFGTLIFSSLSYSSELKSGEFNIPRREVITLPETVITSTKTVTAESEDVFVRRPYQHVGMLRIRGDK